MLAGSVSNPLHRIRVFFDPQSLFAWCEYCLLYDMATSGLYDVPSRQSTDEQTPGHSFHQYMTQCRSRWRRAGLERHEAKSQAGQGIHQD